MGPSALITITITITIAIAIAIATRIEATIGTTTTSATNNRAIGAKGALLLLGPGTPMLFQGIPTSSSPTLTRGTGDERRQTSRR